MQKEILICGTFYLIKCCFFQNREKFASLIRLVDTNDVGRALQKQDNVYCWYVASDTQYTTNIQRGNRFILSFSKCRLIA